MLNILKAWRSIKKKFWKLEEVLKACLLVL